MSGFPVGLRYMALAALSFSVMGALVKVAGARIPTMEIVLARSLVVLSFCAWGLRSRGRSFRGSEPKLLVVRGVVGFISLSCTYYAVIHLPLAEATVIQYTNPVFTALLAAPVLGEALLAAEVLLAALGLVGVLIVARPPFLWGAGEGLDAFVVSVGLVGAVFTAGAYVMVRRLRREEPLLIVFYFALVSALGSLPAVASTFVLPRGPEWGVLLAVGITTYVGQLFLTHGLRHERAGRATAVGYLQIVFAATWGITFFREIPDGWTVAGTALIMWSTFLLARVRGAHPPAVAT